MSGEKKFKDYAAEFEDCMEVLDGELPEYKEVDTSKLKPKADDNSRMGLVSLFDDDEDDPVFDMDAHWRDMPAYEVENMMPFKQLMINFQTEEDMIAFAKLVNRKITKRTKSIWYPERDTIAGSLVRWLDEGEVEDGNDE